MVGREFYTCDERIVIPSQRHGLQLRMDILLRSPALLLVIRISNATVSSAKQLIPSNQLTESVVQEFKSLDDVLYKPTLRVQKHDSCLNFFEVVKCF